MIGLLNAHTGGIQAPIQAVSIRRADDWAFELRLCAAGLQQMVVSIRRADDWAFEPVCSVLLLLVRPAVSIRRADDWAFEHDLHFVSPFLSLSFNPPGG